MSLVLLLLYTNIKLSDCLVHFHIEHSGVLMGVFGPEKCRNAICVKTGYARVNFMLHNYFVFKCFISS